MFDTNKNGSISLDEVKKLLGCGAVSENDTFKDMITEMDRDGNGEISFVEF
jgi:Ca2+-binding EF-hand superfamily protein